MLSIDKPHLSSSIKGVYGSSEINTNEYLRRFIDLEYSLPKPEIKDYLDYLFSIYDLEKYFNHESRRTRELVDEGQNLLTVAQVLFNSNSFTLRQVNNVFTQVRLCLFSINLGERVEAAVLFFLIYLKVVEYDTFKKLCRYEFSLQELDNIFCNLLHNKEEFDRDYNFRYMEGTLLWLYNNSAYSKNESKIKRRAEGVYSAEVKSKMYSGIGQNLDAVFTHLIKTHMHQPGLQMFLNKINLTSPFINSI